ncbi:MAG: PHP domain-containing protein [Eubacteriales bacterium]
MGRIDLHVHTIASSDGELSGEEIVRLALKQDVTTLAITDHDSMDEVENTVYWGNKLGVEVIPGTEVFCRQGNQFVHMLGYYVEIKDSPIIDMVTKINTDRLKWVKEQINLLRNNGIFATEERVYEFCRNTPPLYSAIAYSVFTDPRNQHHPLVKEYKEKYSNPLHEMSIRLLSYGKPFFSPHYIPEVIEFIKIANESGGVAVLAHPGYSQLEVDFKNTEFIDFLVKNGLSGVEVFYTTHTYEETKRYKAYCDDHGLITTCGSDFHGKYKRHISLGQLKITDYTLIDQLKSERDRIRQKC